MKKVISNSLMKISFILLINLIFATSAEAKLRIRISIDWNSSASTMEIKKDNSQNNQTSEADKIIFWANADANKALLVYHDKMILENHANHLHTHSDAIINEDKTSKRKLFLIRFYMLIAVLFFMMVFLF